MVTRTTPRTRERELVKVTRALFDEGGMQDAPVEEIVRAAGIARGLIYRHFSSKEELFVAAVTDYLAELGDHGGGDRRRARPGPPARAADRGLRALLPAIPGLPRLVHLADAPSGEPAVRDRLGIDLAATRAGHGAPERVVRTCVDGALAVVQAG
jgi:AcrR family transcriptional regulator